MHIDAVKEFYASLTLFHYKKKEVGRSRVRGVEIEFDNIRLILILGIPGDNGICEYIKERENGVWWLGSGEHRRRDDEEAAPAEEGESGSDDQFYDAQVEVEEPAAEAPAVPVFSASLGDSINVQKEPAKAGVDSSIPSSSVPDSVVLKLQAELEQA
ncbi:hypothetical protein Dimus_016077 [Dionaea muscipula]